MPPFASISLQVMWPYKRRLLVNFSAQVSRAWRSLAEDEVLWLQLSHQYGYNMENKSTDDLNWKSIFREKRVRQQNLTANWKVCVQHGETQWMLLDLLFVFWYNRTFTLSESEKRCKRQDVVQSKHQQWWCVWPWYCIVENLWTLFDRNVHICGVLDSKFLEELNSNT